MEKIALKKPFMEYDRDSMEFRKEMQEAKDKAPFAGCGGLGQCAATGEWLQKLACTI